MSTAATQVAISLQNYYIDAQENYIMLPGVQDIVNAFTSHTVNGDMLITASQYYQGETNAPAVRTYTFFVTDLPGCITAYDAYIASLNLPTTGVLTSISTTSVELGG